VWLGHTENFPFNDNYSVCRSSYRGRSTYTRLEAIHSEHMRRDSDASTNISAPAYNCALQSEQCAFSACGASRSELGILRVSGKAE
jgi:hypothetical protein